MLWSHWWGEVPGSWPACVDTWNSLISHFLLNVSFNFQGHKDGCLGCFGSNLGNNTFGWLGHLPVGPTVMSFHVTCFITSVQDHSGSTSKGIMGGLHQKTQTTAKTQNEHSESAAIDSGGSAWCNTRFRNPGCAWWSKALHQWYTQCLEIKFCAYVDVRCRQIAAFVSILHDSLDSSLY